MQSKTNRQSGSALVSLKRTRFSPFLGESGTTRPGIARRGSSVMGSRGYTTKNER